MSASTQAHESAGLSASPISSPAWAELLEGVVTSVRLDAYSVGGVVYPLGQPAEGRAVEPPA